ncbi:ribosome small subunit-dependent GTPase A [Acholeplasma hippikon]|uniref:Small ribosomal subunit biogenesis GTPase RsgA n=1 Tax=Acholeplasma hippikon TaxID=264636 RepID=A0A449BK39_9MOLU|nr:ribosome small subunit-dependent GTPase A [Acholeplasma hippikon]VEU82836.1 putative GTPase engC [Acholeplasma hippikon]
MGKALITKLIGGLYTFKDLDTNRTYEGYAKGKFRKIRVEKDSSFNKNLTKKTKKDVKDIVLSPKVGDIVHYEFTSDQYMITDVLERKNELIRPDVANVDQVLLVFSSIRPEFSFNLLDKFLVILAHHDLRPVLVVSKIDLIEESELMKLKENLKHYEKYFDIYYVNSKQRIGFDVLQTIFKDKITVLAGQTGVGKSTLMNALLPHLGLKTQEISDALGRGKHTTRHSEIYEFGGGYIADTPGFSKIEFEFHDYTLLKDYFLDFKEVEHECKFGSKCLHLSEPNCEVKRLVKENIILKSRYDSYLSFVEELKTRKEKY